MAHKSSYLFASALLTAVSYATPDVAFTSIGDFELKNAAFPSIGQFTSDPNDQFLMCSAFKTIGDGHIYMVPGIYSAVSNNDVSQLESQKLPSPQRFKWPNSVATVPSTVFGDSVYAIVVPDGFLVPDHTDGGVYVLQLEDYTSGVTDFTSLQVSSYKISTEDKGYFYHMGKWIDLNQDGRMDFITARSNAKKGKGQLVWFEQPEGGLQSDLSWTEHVVCTDCADVNFDMQYINQFPGEVVIFAAEFFNERLAFYRVSTSTGELVDSRIIDETQILSAYSVTYTDVNMDGVYELIVNNHEKKDKQTGIFAYKFPEDGDWMNGEFSRTILAGDFDNAFSLLVPNMSPGFVYPDFYPQTRMTNREAPHFLVAGDGDHTAHLMTPTDATNFVYDLDTIKEMDGTVGALAYGDVDGDGWQEVFVPDYDNDKIEVFKFSSLTNQSQSWQFTE